MTLSFRPLIWMVSLLVLVTGCAYIPSAPQLGLQRTLFPGLANLSEEDIGTVLEKRVELNPPLSAAIVWLTESTSAPVGWEKPLNEYQRTGVLEAAVGALRRAPFYTVTTLPTMTGPAKEGDAGRTLDGVRSAAARFQSNVAILLQTGTAEDRGINPYAIGYLGLITAPLFPGEDVALATSAEMCAMDVRSGVMLACTLGRATRKERFLFLWNLDERRDEAREENVKEAVVDAAAKLVSEVALRVGR
jgi:hypothetical protein